jgi:hypothetical protein
MMFDVTRAAKREDVGGIAHAVWCGLTRDDVVHVFAGKAAVCTVRMLFNPSLPERTPMTKPQVRRLDHLKPMSETSLAIKDGKQ